MNVNIICKYYMVNVILISVYTYMHTYIRRYIEIYIRQRNNTTQSQYQYQSIRFDSIQFKKYDVLYTLLHCYIMIYYI